MKKLFTLLMLLAASAHAGPFYDLRLNPSSGTLKIGMTGTVPVRDAVLTSSGAAVVQSTSATSAYKPFRVKNVAGTEVLSVTQGGTTAGTFSGGLTGNVTGNADTATALAALPTACSAGNYPLGILASGNATGCTAAGIGDVVKASTQTLSGTNNFTSVVNVTTINVVSGGYFSGFRNFVSTRSFAGDQNITTTAFPGTAVSGSTLTLTGVRAGSFAEYHFRLRRDDSSNSFTSFVVLLDGAQGYVGTSDQCKNRFTTNGTPESVTCSVMFGPLTSGSHSFVIQGYSSSGALIINKGNPPMDAMVEELIH